MKGLEALFRPRSIAVVGASREPGKLGHVLLKNVLEAGFAGEVFPVNPAGGEILGRAVFPSVRALPRAPDLLLLSVPNRLVPAAIRDGARRGAQAAVILASGFGEMGGEGAVLQRAVRVSGLRVLGPNCMGIFHRPAGLNGTYFWDLPRRDGGLAFVSQSGAYGGLLFREIRRRGMGLSTFVSIGNQADISHADVMEHLAADPAIRAVALFIEQVKEGRRFLDACRRLAARKAVVALKAGRTAAGRRAALSHTGSMAGDFEVCRAALRQAGAIVAQDTDSFFDLLAALDGDPRLRGRCGGLGIVTISGGPCVIAADACEEEGVGVPELTAATQAKVRRLIPEFGASRNPVDMTPQMDPAKMPACVDAVARDPAIGALLAIDVGLDRPGFADAFVRTRARRPVIAFVADAAEIARRFAEAGIPLFDSPERAVRTFAALSGGGAPKALPPPSRGGALNEWESKRLLRGAGVPFCREERATSAAVALAAARRIGYPVAVKSLGAGAHKWRAGGVVLAVKDERALESAYRGLARRFGRAVLVQEMVDGGAELLIGARRDPTFGPVALFGAGGVRTEERADLAIRVGPVDRREALAMIAETRVGGGLRRRGPIARILVSLSRWMARHVDVDEVDLNPVIAGGGRPTAVDALVVMRRKG